MKPTFRVIFLTLIAFVFGAAAVSQAQIATTTFESPKEVVCNDSPVPGEIYSPAQDPAQVDYYKISVLSGQKLIIDVDAEKMGSTLDALLEVYEPDETFVDANNDQLNNTTDDSLDPYLEIAPSPNDATYTIAISSGSDDPTDADDSQNTGSYTISFQCSDQPSSSEFKWPVVVGDLLGATGSKTGSLISINPEKGESSLPFALGSGPITDIEFDPGNEIILVAVNAGVIVDELGGIDAIDTVDSVPAKIVAIDPVAGSQIESYSLEANSVIALEAAENKLYAIRADSSGENFALAEVIFDGEAKIAVLTDVVSLGKSVVQALAYNRSEKIMYGASGVNLLKINLASPSNVIEKVELSGLSEGIAALDFSNEDDLFGVDLSGNLFKVSDLSNGQAMIFGEPIAEISGLTFAVGKATPDEEPIKTLCSSTLTSTSTASSATDATKLSKLKFKNNPLHRAIGLFKFQGKAGERVTLRLAPEGEESAVAGEETALSPLRSWLNCRGKGRVFLGIRDAIPHVDFRVRKKHEIPFDMSADLPADGYYYVMVIRPLLRFYQTDYCLTLESDHQDSQAWQTLDVVWPDDHSKEDTAATSTEEKAVFESVDEGRDQVVQEVEETTTEGTVEPAPVKETTAEVTEQSAVMGAPPITDETTVDDTSEVAPESSAF